MNLKIILKSLGILLICEAGSMLLSLLVSIIYAEPSFIYFIYSIIIITIIGLPLIFINTQNTIFYAKDGFAIVSLGWILVSLFGALPFFLSGYIPSLVNSIFETISGFTTTGASILVNIESLPKGILFWRSFTHWIGGMGVLMLTLAILPSAGAKSFHIMKAESPGPSPEKLVPKIRHTARILYEIYFAISLAEVIALLVAGMPLYGFRWNAEFILVGTKGKKDMFPKTKLIPAVFQAENIRHSQKPDRFYKMIEPLGEPRIDIFARTKRDKWDVWGNEVESDIDLTPLNQ